MNIFLRFKITKNIFLILYYTTYKLFVSNLNDTKFKSSLFQLLYLQSLLYISYWQQRHPKISSRSSLKQKCPMTRYIRLLVSLVFLLSAILNARLCLLIASGQLFYVKSVGVRKVEIKLIDAKKIFI